MARDDYILNKPDRNDLHEFDTLIRKALLAKRKIENGFLELAECIFYIHKKKLYKVQYKTFSEFCEEGLGFSRQTIYVYLGILKLITTYPDQFPREKAIEFGHKKMRYITEGVNTIDKNVDDKEKKEELLEYIFNNVEPSMASTEIEAFIEDVIEEL